MHDRQHSRAVGFRGRALTCAVVIGVSVLVSSCDLFGRLVFFQETPPSIPASPAVSQGTPAPAPTPAAELPLRTLPPVADVDPAEVRRALAEMGWERMEVPDARVAMMLPPGWYTAVPHNGDMSLGDFENLRPDSKRRSAAQAALGNSDLMRAYAQSGEYAQGGDAAVILHLTAWNDAGNIPLEDLGRVLREDRLVKGEWYEIGSVPTGLGDGQRLHYWSEWEGRAHSTVEVVFLAPDGNPYTLSVLTDAAIADRTWAEFDQVMLSLEPLAER